MFKSNTYRYNANLRRIATMKAKMGTCNKCGARVLTARMADHWIIAGHASDAGATCVNFPLDKHERSI